jgi:1,4-dihydroxy-2-naphthoate polyprenyltransferase
MTLIRVATASRHLMRALRLPFLSASLLPYVFGSLLGDGLDRLRFVLGLLTVAATHLSANVLNDFADSRSGADWHDRTWYGFFGGSKLIQEGKLTESFYLRTAIVLAGIATLSTIALTVLMGSPLPLPAYAAILILGWAYSAKPIPLSHRRLGEAVVFLLFGPACVMGGYFIQSGMFPEGRAFALSLPFGFMTAAILLANEVPDLEDDLRAGKRTLVSLTGQARGYLLYTGAVACALGSVGLCYAAGWLGNLSFAAYAAAIPSGAAAVILRRHADDKATLVRASKLAIGAQALLGVALIMDVIL